MSGLVVRDLVCRRAGIAVADGINATVPTGTVAILVGPNGAGKSTFLDLVAGVERAESGSIEFAGRSLGGASARERARSVALVEQRDETDPSWIVRDVVMVGRHARIPRWSAPDAEDAEAVRRALARVDAHDLIGRRMGELSGGERQRVLIARALVQEPGLLLLDEPTAHLDIGARLRILALIRSLSADGMTIVLAVHDLDIALAFGDTVTVLDRGRVAASGRPREVLTPELVARVYGVQAEIVRGSDGSLRFGFSLP